MIEAVLFDIDDTLVDHSGAAREAVVAAFPEADAARVARRWFELEEEYYERYLAGELGFAEQRRLRVTTLAAELGLGEWAAARADAWIAAYAERYKAGWRLFPDVAACLDACGLPMAVVTNSNGDFQRTKLAAVGLDGRFPIVVASEDVGVAKPDPEIFRVACRLLDVEPSRTAYVGDRLTTDALGARAAGLRGVWLDRSGGAAPDDPGVVRITTLADLAAVLA
ncbi:HAD family hydrolase [Actinomadura sp. 21ATH]|uniref:HAD family hydrolase n=1 Tax=Actinomadura sp. 21ATH TaxID=1735444 RepID=UPI0035C1159C